MIQPGSSNHSHIGKVLILLVLFSALGIPTLPLHPVHAIGSLSVDPSFITPDPTVSNLSVDIRVDGMDQFNAWYIEILTDPTALNATSFTVTGQFAHFEATHCVNGQGYNCVVGEDRPGVVHSEAVITGTPPSPPVSAVLLTINYKTGSNQFTNIHFVVSQINLASNHIQHSTTDGAYGVPPAPDFTMSSTNSSISTLPNKTAKTNITITSVAGFAGKVNLTAAVNLSGLSVALQPNNVTLDSTHLQQIATLSASSSVSLDYTVTVTGTASVGSHYAVVEVSVKSPGYFTIDAPSSQLKMPALTTGSEIIDVRSQYGFSGDITLTVRAPQPPYVPSQVNATLSSTRLHLVPDGVNSTTLTVSIPASAFYFDYRINVTGVSGSSSQTYSVEIIPPTFDLGISAATANLTTGPGGSVHDMVLVGSLYYYGGFVYLQSSMSHGTARLNSTNPFIQIGQTIYISLNITVDPGTEPATYAILLTIYTPLILTLNPPVQVVHNLALTVTVASPTNVARQPTSLTILGLAPLVYFAILGGALVIFLLLTVQTYRKMKEY